MMGSASPDSQYTAQHDQSQGPPRKRMRKGTKSCIECRRRKIKCTFDSDRPNVCNECFTRGSTCIDQEHKEVSHASAQADSTSTLRDRVTQLEDLVKQVLNRLPEKPTEQHAKSSTVAGQDADQVDTQAAAEVLKSLRIPIKSNATMEDSMLIPADVQEAPVLSLFDNAVLQRREVPATISRAQYNKSKRLIAALMGLLPTPEDLEIILENSQEWWAIWRTMFPQITDRRCVTIKESVSHSLRSEKPAEIAKIMLCIALSINQLPQGFDWSRISIQESPSELMERYISTVDRLVTSDDEIAATVDGIECMILEAKYHINLGRPRRSWLLYHRAIAFAQLIGLHRLAYKKPPRPDTEYHRRVMVWAHLVMGDRYLALVLGLPYSVADTFCSSALQEAAASAVQSAAGEAYIARTVPLVTKLIDRNQNLTTSPYTLTLGLDTELEELQSSVASSWWSTGRVPGSTIEEHFDRLQAQFFHHHVRVLLHMPFMLRSSTNKQYQYSHSTALDSSRKMIQYFDALRGAEDVGPHVCKLLDFQAFTAAMLLLLNLCGYSQHIRGAAPQQPDLDQDQQDSMLIDRTITLLRVAANEAGGAVASQCAKALDMLAKVRTGECTAHKDAAARGETCQIAIPYFGTISVSAGQQFVPIKPGTYPDAGTARQSLGVPPATSRHPSVHAQTGLPTPPSMTSGSGHASPNMPTTTKTGSAAGSQPHDSPYHHSLDGGPGGGGAGGAPGLDQSWTISTENPFITFDSFMSIPGAPPFDFTGGSGSVGSGGVSASQMPYSFGNFGTFDDGSAAAGPQFPGGGGGGLSMELDNGWNWYGVDGPVL